MVSAAYIEAVSMPKANHFVPPLFVLFLGCTALTSGAQAGWLDFGSEKPKPAPVQPEAKEKAPPAPAANLDDSIRQAQMLRLAGASPEAIRHLSQLMMVAADDPRVVSEYGKTLAQMGRASDAVNFLTRATQLSPTDWTLYSAMGVAYDQIGNQKQAQAAYEHALTLHPGEVSVLNNYALSRMLAKDTAMAQNLAGKAELANAAFKDEKIARNVAMIRSMAPEAPATAVAAARPAPAKIETNVAASKPVSAPQSFTPVAQQALPAQPPKVSQAPLPAPDNRVVMQRVPVDPLAGPVASHAPRSLQSTAKTEVAAAKPEPKADAHKPVAKPETVAAKTDIKPVAKPESAAKAEAPKTAPVTKPEVKTAQVKPAPVAKPEAKTAEVKPVEAKPVAKLDIAPGKVEAPKPEVKAASAKPAPVKPEAKAEAKPADSKTSIPGLRLSANAF